MAGFSSHKGNTMAAREKFFNNEKIECVTAADRDLR